MAIDVLSKYFSDIGDKKKEIEIKSRSKAMGYVKQYLNLGGKENGKNIESTSGAGNIFDIHWSVVIFHDHKNDER